MPGGPCYDSLEKQENTKRNKCEMAQRATTPMSIRTPRAVAPIREKICVINAISVIVYCTTASILASLRPFVSVLIDDDYGRVSITNCD